MNKRLNIALLLPLAFQDGLDFHEGIMRYLNAHRRAWRIQIAREVTNKAASAAIFNSGLDGMIANYDMFDCFAGRLARTRFPLVLLNLDRKTPFLRRPSTVFVDIDSRALATTAARFLTRDKPYADYGFAGTAQTFSWTERRFQPFAELLARKKLSVSRFAPRTVADRADELARWLKSLRKPAAVFADCDRTAVEVIDACAQTGLRVPQEVAVLGVDNERITCMHTEPSLSSIQPDFVTEGARAAAALDAMLAGRKTPREIVCSHNTLVKRRSTGAPSQGGWLVQKADELIRKEACKGLKAAQVSTRLGVSRRLLDLRYRQLRGRTILDTILDTRIDAAKELLRNTKLPIREIAAATGLSDVSYAQRLFKHRVGETMRTYRRTTEPQRRS